MWSFLPVVENKKRRAGFHIRPQRCSQMHNIFWRSAATRTTAFIIFYLLFIICEHEVSYNESILKQSPDQTRG